MGLELKEPMVIVNVKRREKGLPILEEDDIKESWWSL